MSDDLTRAIAEALGCSEGAAEDRDYSGRVIGMFAYCTEHGEDEWPCPEPLRIAAALAPLVEERVREAKSLAWGRGYFQGVRDTANDVEPADNPYLTEEVRNG